MSLGADQTVCLTELQNALRPIVGDAVDSSPTKDNLGALALAIYKILTADAAASVDPNASAAWHTWLQAVGTATGAGAPPASPLTGRIG